MTASKRVLVTGVGGFIGSNLAAELIQRGLEVNGVVRPSSDLWRLHHLTPHLRLHTADVADTDALRRVFQDVDPEIVFHLALSTGHPLTAEEHEDLARGGILGTWNALQVAAALGVQRFVHIGSSLEYGEREAPLEESDPVQPGTFRGAVKAAATLLSLGMWRTAGLSVVVLRPFYVYGPWDNPAHLIPRAIRAAFLREELPLTESTYVHDPVYVEDVIDACILAGTGDALAGEVINVGSGRQLRNHDIVRAIEEATGRPIEIRSGAFPARPSDRRHWVADIKKAKRLLGWEPRHTLEMGLESTLRWYETQPDMAGWEPSSNELNT